MTSHSKSYLNFKTLMIHCRNCIKILQAQLNLIFRLVCSENFLSFIMNSLDSTTCKIMAWGGFMHLHKNVYWHWVFLELILSRFMEATMHESYPHKQKSQELQNLILSQYVFVTCNNFRRCLVRFCLYLTSNWSFIKLEFRYQSICWPTPIAVIVSESLVETFKIPTWF